MKKVNYLVIGAAGLLLASCSQDPMGPTVAQKGEGNFNISVKIPALNIDTRADFTAFGEGKVANNLYYAVYDANANDKLVIGTQTGEFTVDGDYLTTEVSLNLATGKKYKIAFFAQSEASKNEEVYTFNAGPNSATVTVNYENMTNANNLADAYDCFYDVIEVTPSSTETTAEAELTRPLAQVNWGTDDLGALSVKDENAYGDNGKYIETYLTVTPYQTLNLFDGSVSDPIELSLFGPFTSPSAMDPAIAFPVEGYDYVAMNYLLVPAESSVLGITLNITNKGGNGDLDIPIKVASVPVQANYRTNIYGNLLSDDVEVNVEKDPTWGDPDYLVSPEAVKPPMEDGKYIVSTQGHLNWIADQVKNPDLKGFYGTTFVLGQDIYLTEDFTPIGTFQGTFDGNDHTIFNMNLPYDGGVGMGMFKSTSGATIKNLTIHDVNISTPGNGNSWQLGTLIGIAYGGLIDNVTVTGSVNIDAPTLSYVGGLVGVSSGAKFNDVEVSGDENSSIVGGPYVGGIVGIFTTGATSINKATADITVSGSSYVGGIMGSWFSVASTTTEINVTNCTNNGEVINRSNANGNGKYFIGGIAGAWPNRDNLTVTFAGCYNNGDLSWSNWADAPESLKVTNDIVGAGNSDKPVGTLYINGKNESTMHWLPGVELPEEPGEDNAN